MEETLKAILIIIMVIDIETWLTAGAILIEKWMEVNQDEKS